MYISENEEYDLNRRQSSEETGVCMKERAAGRWFGKRKKAPKRPVMRMV
jgi:hypothetical protein